MIVNEVEAAKNTLANAKALPVRCYGYMPSDPELVILVERGMHGYSPYKTMGGRSEAIKLNAAVGVTVQQMEAMVAGSLFGFHVPAADPAIYDENGKVCGTKFGRSKSRKC